MVVLSFSIPPFPFPPLVWAGLGKAAQGGKLLMFFLPVNPPLVSTSPLSSAIPYPSKWSPKRQFLATMVSKKAVFDDHGCHKAEKVLHDPCPQ